MAKCGCSGQTCGCAIKNGVGTSVTGTGTTADPFTINVDPSTINLTALVRSANSNSAELTRLGSGSVTDPLVFTAAVVLRSPDSSRWAPSITNGGVVTWAKL